MVSGPVGWTTRLSGAHGALATIAIAIGEVLLGLGIAWRPTFRLALAASVAWAFGVWWLGEGLGGLLTPGANPVTGALGAVIIYAMLAVVLWPPSRDAPGRAAGGQAGGQAAGRGATGGQAAGGGPAGGQAASAAAAGAGMRVLWLVLWGGMSLLCLRQALWAPGALGTSVTAVPGGQPRWLASWDAVIGGALARHGFVAGLILAAVLAVIAAAVFLPVAARRAAVILAAILGVLVWIVGQNFGGLLTGMATDPNSGPVLVLAAAAYWPISRRDKTAIPDAVARPHAATPFRLHAAVRADGPRDGHHVGGRLNPLLEGIWLVTFIAAAAWFAGRAIRDWLSRTARAQHITHLLSCGGMLVISEALTRGVASPARSRAQQDLP